MTTAPTPGPKKNSTLGLSRPILAQKVNFPLCLAPMVGLSHVAMRAMMREYLPANAKTIWPTEMLNSRRVPHENLKTTPETLRFSEDSELVPQILGNAEDEITASVLRLQEWGAEGIDINMGCPVKKALSHNYGVALMGDPDYAAEVVRLTVQSSSLPVSVKLRSGLNHDPEFLHRFVSGLEKAGASWITLHPRTAGQQRRGRADWSQIREVRERLSMGVIGNGDIQTCTDAIEMLEQTGCDMAMAGRALAARPWMLWQFGEAFGFSAPPHRTGEKAPQTPLEEGAEFGRAALSMLKRMKHYFMSEAHVSEALVLRKYSFYLRTTSPWLKFGHDLYARATRAKSIEELETSVEAFFKMDQEMVPRTELRQ